MVTHKELNPFRFEGWGRPKSNYFKMPQQWTDITARLTSLAEIKVVEYVLKHTWGFQEFGVTKKITTDEFMHGRKRKNGTRLDRGTGLSNRSVIDGLRAAVSHGLLIEEVDDRDRARIKKSYALRMLAEPEEETAATSEPERDAETVEVSLEGSENSDVKNLHSGVKNLHSWSETSSHRSEKDTLERNLQKETVDLSKISKGLDLSEEGAKTGTPDTPGNGSDPGKGPFSEAIARYMEDLTTHDLHDLEHVRSNVTQAMNLWRDARLDEAEFLALVDKARRVTLKHTGNIRRKVTGPYGMGLKNRAPYFFEVLKRLVRERVVEVDREKMQAALRQRSVGF